MHFSQKHPITELQILLWDFYLYYYNYYNHYHYNSISSLWYITLYHDTITIMLYHNINNHKTITITLLLKEHSGSFQPDVFPINVAIVSLCVRLTLFSQLCYRDSRDSVKDVYYTQWWTSGRAAETPTAFHINMILTRISSKVCLWVWMKVNTETIGL